MGSHPMQNVIGKSILAASAAGLALYPVAAQANTRAGSSASYYVASANSQPGLQRAAEGEDELAWIDDEFMTILLGSIGVGAALIMVFWGGSGGGSGGFQSNGAN